MNERTFESYGIVGVRANGQDVQRVKCPECGVKSRTPTDCLTVWVKDGTWSCNKCGWGKGLSLKRELKEWREVVPKGAFSELSENQIGWLLGRGITMNVIKRNRIAQARHYFGQVQGERNALCFRYYVGSRLVNVKYRDSEKNFSQEKDADKTFYKINDVADTVIITEGEIDALSFEVAGFENAVSVPDGAPSPGAKNTDKKFDYLDDNRHFFKDCSKIYLATDTDTAGLGLREELARRLGKRRCYIVKYPEGCKDANDVLRGKGIEALRACIESALPYPVEGAIQASERFDNLRELHRSGFPDGVRVGLENFDRHFSFHTGQLTVVTGVPAHGKSTFIDYLTVRLAIREDWRTAFFTPENYPQEVHMMRLVKQFSGKPFLPNYGNRINENELSIAMEYLQEYAYYIQPENESYTLDSIIDIAEYFVASRGIKLLVIDPWNTIEHQRSKEQSETEYIGKTLNKLKYVARRLGIHVILIAHPAKMQKQKGNENYEVPTPYDISGSANWYNVPDNILTVYRRFNTDGDSTTEVYIQKVKHEFIGQRGMIPFTFNRANSTFTELLYNSLSSNHLQTQPSTNGTQTTWDF